MNLAKAFLILSIASSLSKNEEEKEGRVNFSGMESAIAGVTPEGLGTQWNLGPCPFI